MTTTPTITPEEALAKVKEALESCSSSLCALITPKENLSGMQIDISTKWAREALALIPIIEGAMLPDIPEGFAAVISYDSEEAVAAMGKIGSRIENECRAPKPRAAILAAKGKVVS